ncbi:MAG: DUF2293 domain-containing protein [Gemmatimonadales bacterium]
MGRTAAAKRFEPEAIELAVQAHVRHVHTRYDKLLGRRLAVAAEVEDVLDRWRRPA